MNRKIAAMSACETKNQEEKSKQNKVAKDEAACNKKKEQYPLVYSWDSTKKRCVNKADTASSKAIPGTDECNNAAMFAGDLKGQNCKKALDVVRDVKARNSAVTDATTAATTAYSSLQATGATGAQDDAQTRQANIMKTLAMSKFVTGALSLSGAMQLKSAASGAADANSTISGAQKQLQAACGNADDDQACFYQNAAKYGVPADARNYASFSRMKQAAQQSQDQADAASALAKSSMLTGAADMLVGLQAMRAAQMANANAQAMAPPPLIAAAPPPMVAFGDGQGAVAAPSLAPGAVAPPVDYGNPGDNNDTFGGQRHGPMSGSLVPGHMGAPNIFKAASSGVSGGGGAGVAGGGGGGGRAAASRGRSTRHNTVVGEYNLGGGGGFKGGAGAEKTADAANPLADMLAKLFPQDQNGKTVVDTRQVASATGGTYADDADQGEPGVTASDLSIFEQISAKYHQLNGEGRL
jgi:hypothetical protein